jgi:hypothetical protein
MSRSAKGFCHGLRGGGENFTDSHARHTFSEGITVDGIAVAEEVGRCGIVWEGVHDLLGGPGGGGVLGHVEVDGTPAVVSEHDEDEEDTQTHGGDREEIDRDQVDEVVGRGTSARSELVRRGTAA